VNARTGFLEELVLEPPGGMMVRVSLVQYETGSIPDARHFDVPDRDTSADDLSEWAQARTCTCIRLRKAAMDHVQRVLLRGNPLTRERALDELRRFLVALYDPEILEAWGSWLEDSPRLLGAWTGQLRSLENAGASMYSLALAVALHRGVIAGSLEVFRSRLGERLPADPEEYFDLPAWHEVHDLELSLFQARFDALIKKPILEELDRRVGEALGD
jgi:hypothetical protein